ncbi:MAG TPA: alpha/beta hydrolase [Gaiellales bacterium]
MPEPLEVTTPEGSLRGWRYAGQGPQAVLLHGGPCISARYMEPLVPHLAGVFQQILYQQRGLAPSAVGEPFTVDANVRDAGAVIDQAAGGRAWIVGHSWGGHLALHMLAAIPERIAGAVIIDPLGAHLEVVEEFGERLRAPLTEAERARVDELEAKEEAGTATSEESMESFRIVWPSYFADPPSAPPMPDMDMAVGPFTATFASIAEHDAAGTLVRALPSIPSEIPVVFIHGAASPMPLRASTGTAELIPHARVEVIAGAGHFTWLERPDEVRDTVAAIVAR